MDRRRPFFDFNTEGVVSRIAKNFQAILLQNQNWGKSVKMQVAILFVVYDAI